MGTDLEDAKERYDQALGALGAAEDVGWPLAGVSAILVYQQWHSWVGAIGVFLLSYFFATYRYRREEKAAELAYKQLTR